MIQPTLLLSSEEETALTAACLKEGRHVDRLVTGLVLDWLASQSFGEVSLDGPEEAKAKPAGYLDGAKAAQEAALLAKLNLMEKERAQTRMEDIEAIAQKYAPSVPSLKEEALTGPTGERKFFGDQPYEPEPT